MNILLWVIQILVALLFLMSGVMKFVMPYADMIKDSPVVFPHWFFLFIGVCEILGGIGLVIPWLTKTKPGLTSLAAALLVIIMIGATFVTAMGPTATMAVVPAFVGILCILIALGRRSKA